MRRAVWGLPQAGILVNKCLRQKLALFGYYESTNTPGLWLHDTWPILFTLVVDDFGVKNVNSDDVQHLIASIKNNYSVTKDWTGDLYCGLNLSGIMSIAPWIHQCRVMLRRNYRNMGILNPKSRRHVLTHRSQRNLELKPKPPSPQTYPQNWMQKESNVSNKLLAVFCIMHGPST
jgi:hypothetical protein